MGTPDFAVPTLERLLRAHDVIGVFTQPDRPAGRGRRPRPSPVKQLAEEWNVPILQPYSLRRDPEAVSALRGLVPDIVVVAAYGMYLPTEALEAAPAGTVNVHASLLPRWRGASPVAHALMAGDRRTGATIMLLDEGWDTGPILSQCETDIGAAETAGDLKNRLSRMGADLLIETLPGWLAGEIAPRVQDDAAATLAPRLSRSDGALDWSCPASELARRVRALHPWPGAFTTLPDGDRLKVHRATAVTDTEAADTEAASAADAAVGGTGPKSLPENLGIPDVPGIPGTTLLVRGAFLVATGTGLVRLDEVQAAGRRRVSGADFVRGRSDVIGAVLQSAGPAA
jgi:methionyl-tRNA formyltransferase